MIVALFALAAVLLAIEGVRKLKQPRCPAPLDRLPLPPGPKPTPFFGNVLGINRDAPYLTYKAWSETYGMSQRGEPEYLTDVRLSNRRYRLYARFGTGYRHIELEGSCH